MTLKIGVFVTGGIAAYKTPLVVRALVRAGHEVRVVATAAALNFVTEATLATVSKHAVLTDTGEFGEPAHVAHVELAHWMDVALVVPATANTIAKLAAGFADNVVTTTLLAFSKEKLIVPAMNDQMWQNAQTQANIAHLAAMGARILPPATGFLAEGYQAVGRMPDVDVIAAFVASVDAGLDLTGKRVVVTAGGTRERIDPVRYIGNDSSGKMGTALANVAAAAGATVTLITTADLPVLTSVTQTRVQSAQEMQAAVQAADCDVVIMAAAVADYRVAESAAHKLKKHGEDDLTLHLVQNPDILAGLGHAKDKRLVVGFAAETDDLLQNAQAKLAKKGADLLVANQVGAGVGFNQDHNAVWLLTPGATPQAVADADKTAVAKAILAKISEMMG